MDYRDKIILIGMPGCGKTTIGKVLAKELKYNFYDMDEYIENRAKKSINDIFSEDGEEAFRNLETEALKEVINKKRILISTGGGIVKRDLNLEILKNSGIVVFINRPVEKILEDLNTESRPLLKDSKEKLYDLYEERFSRYKEVSNIEVINKGYLRDTVDLIKYKLKGKIRE